MKDYINYMDNITPDPALKGKILKRARSKQISTVNGRTFLSFAGIVATAAVLLLGMWFMPGALNNLRNPAQDPATGWSHSLAPGSGYGSAITGGTPYDTGLPARNFPEDGIIIPERSFIPPSDLPYTPGIWRDPASDSREFYPREVEIFDHGSPRHSTAWMTFSHELTDAQLHSVFPTLGQDFDISAIYAYNGNLNEVFAFWYCPDTRHSVQIRVAEGGIMHPRQAWPDDDIQFSYIHGIRVTFITSGADPFMLFAANFMLDDIAYCIIYSGESNEGRAQVDEIVDLLISGGAADLSVLADPVIPLLRNCHLTLEEARQDTEYGAFLPTYVPAGLTLGLANRWVCQHSSYLLLSWNSYADTHLRWMITRAEDHHHNRLVTANDFESQERNMRFPVFDGEASRARRAFSIPVIAVEDLTLEMLESFAVWLDNHIDNIPDWYVLFSFSVMYGDIVIEISASGLSAQQLWDMLPLH